MLLLFVVRLLLFAVVDVYVCSYTCDVVMIGVTFVVCIVMVFGIVVKCVGVGV